jgi:post-segregation antitoxin (ccd killing protein)
MAKVSLTAGIDVKLAAKVVERAERAGLPLSAVVERALAQYLEQPQEPKRQRARSGRVATLTTEDQGE